MSVQDIKAAQVGVHTALADLSSAVGTLIDSCEAQDVPIDDEDNPQALAWRGSALAHRLADLASSVDSIWSQYQSTVQEWNRQHQESNGGQ
jgi:hypothetical protein